MRSERLFLLTALILCGCADDYTEAVYPEDKTEVSDIPFTGLEEINYTKKSIYTVPDKISYVINHQGTVIMTGSEDETTRSTVKDQLAIASENTESVLKTMETDK